MKLIFAALALAMLTGVGFAAEPRRCETLSSLANEARTTQPYAERITLSGLPAARFIARFNAIAPPSKYVGDGVLIVHASPRSSFVAIRLKGCVVHKGVIPRPAVEHSLKGVKQPDEI